MCIFFANRDFFYQIPNADDLAAQEEIDQQDRKETPGGSPITTQPSTTSSPKKSPEATNNGNANSTPIALGPPPSSSAPIALGPPPSSGGMSERSELTTSSPSKRYSSTDNNW